MSKIEPFDLQKAFHPMPDACRAALMDTARSVQTENRVNRTLRRVLLIAVLVLLAVMAVAYAVSSLGLVDFFGRYYHTSVPDAARTELSATEQKAYSVGPLNITLRETLADGRLVYVTTDATPADGSTALIQMSNGDIGDQLPASEATRLKVPESSTFLEAAKSVGVPLYTVLSYLSIEDDMSQEEMQDILWDSDGSALLVDMLITHPEIMPKTLSGTLHLKVVEINTSSVEYAEVSSWEIEDTVLIPVSGVTAEKTYFPTSEFALDGFSLQNVKAEQTCAGIYLSAIFTASETATQDDADQLMHDLHITDPQGNNFPLGISLSASLDIDAWPKVVEDSMISANVLPDSLRLVDGSNGSGVLLQ